MLLFYVGWVGLWDWFIWQLKYTKREEKTRVWCVFQISSLKNSPGDLIVWAGILWYRDESAFDVQEQRQCKARGEGTGSDIQGSFH